ncbi:hypothetical protein FQN54_003641 [Arachnomyces sp. PD_36]|nr:hypothetical protein FQN54_003641 [Arachnomyces sp. PD_36]
MPDSSWPYHFLTLSREQVAERRTLLTQRGIFTQVSAFIVIFSVGVYRYATRNGKSSRPTGQVKSWLDSPPRKGWSETRRQYFVCLAWLFWVLELAVWKTGDDYLHLTKSLGRVGLAHLPLQVLLSPKFLTSPNTSSSLLPTLLNTTQSSLTPYHRLLGRLVTIPLLVLHSILYLTFFFSKLDVTEVPIFFSRVWDSDVQLGLVALCGVLGLWATSSTVVGLGGLRKRVSRKVFYYVHVGVVVGLLVVVFFHVEFTRPFVVGTVVVWGVDLVMLSRGGGDGNGAVRS